MKINVITIFPEIMKNILSMGMLGVAYKKGVVDYCIVDPRDFAADKHRTVDDEPYGGGGGMIMMAPPIVEAVESLELAEGCPVVLLNPGGARFTQRLAHRFAEHEELTFLCGRYKGVDQRVRELVVTDEVSIGDFVLSGGELAAAVCIEAGEDSVELPRQIRKHNCPFLRNHSTGDVTTDWTKAAWPGLYMFIKDGIYQIGNDYARPKTAYMASG